jgi:hypothetical protein
MHIPYKAYQQLNQASNPLKSPQDVELNMDLAWGMGL